MKVEVAAEGSSANGAFRLTVKVSEVCFDFLVRFTDSLK